MTVKRAWAMPSHNTLSIKPIREFALSYIIESVLSADPFALNAQECVLTNDINPNSTARFHLKALDFLKLPDVQKSDLILFDPPYSLRQVKECYENFGLEFGGYDSRNAVRWTDERNTIASFQKQNDVVLSFGWTSTCMGKKRGYEIESILLCSHGPAHNDTICVAERKTKPAQQENR